MRKFHSFTELGANIGVRIKESKPKTTLVCRKCGGVMTRIKNTNVFVCGGTQEDGKPCRNMVLTAIRHND